MPWYTEVTRWGQTNLTENDPPRIDLDFWRKYWKKMRIGGVIVNAGGIVAYYPSRFPLQYRAKELGNDDLLGRFIRTAREEGLAIIARMDSNRATEEFYRAHPDWFCVDRDGKPYQSQGRYFSCVNSDYYREYLPAVLREIVEREHPDGFADNSWSGMRKGTICYCDNCRKRFQADCGAALPEKADWEDPIYRKYVNWSYRCRTEVWQRFDRVVQEAGGPDCRWIGMVNADPADLGGHYVDLHAVCSMAPVVLNDHQSRNALDGFEQNVLNGQLVHLLGGEDKLVLESMAHYVTGDRTFRLSAMPAAEVQTWMAAGFAGGISPWFHHISGGTEDRRRFSSTPELMQWHEKNELSLYSRKSLADVALLWSRENSDFYGRDQVRQRVSLPWRGFTAALRDMRMPFLPLNASDLGREKGRLRAVILPDLAAMSDVQEEALCTYLREGGSILLTGKSGLLNEEGLPRRESKLWRMLGMELASHAEESTAEARGNWENAARHTYLALEPKRHALWKGLEDTDILGFGGILTPVRSLGLLKPLGGVIPPFPIYPPEMAAIPQPDWRFPVMLAGELPWGGRAVYLAADIDRCYGQDRLPDHSLLLQNAVDWVIEGQRSLWVDGPGKLAVSLYQQGKRKILHLVNVGEMDGKPGYRDEILPLPEVIVSLPLVEDGNVCSLTRSVPPETWRQDGRMYIKIQQLELQEVLVVEEKP